MSSTNIESAVWPANEYSGAELGELSAYRGGATGIMKVRVPQDVSYRPPEGWRIDSVLTQRERTIVRLERDG